jgi:hypothetical protein
MDVEGRRKRWSFRVRRDAFDDTPGRGKEFSIADERPAFSAGFASSGQPNGPASRHDP